MEVHWKRSHKKATIYYKAYKHKVSGFLAKILFELVRNLHGIIIPERTIQCAVAEGTTGMSPRERDKPGSIPDFNFNHLKFSFESYIRIKQINGKGSECDRKNFQRNNKEAHEEI